MEPNTGLPVESILDELRQALAAAHAAVLEAPPGSGKTTVVPLALLDEAWLGRGRILMLEPRRLAARSAAHRLASLLDETPGATVGYRMRLDTRVGPATRIEVITEGILARMLQEDPSLAGVGLVIFDEYHERSLDADLALSLCLKGREMFRSGDDPLRLLVMSATMETARVARLLGGAPVVRAEGRTWPVEVTYLGASSPRERIADRMATAIRQARSKHPQSSVLAFLPGQGEISAVANALETMDLGDAEIHSLYGNLAIEQQQAAIEPAPRGKSKIVLATNIAETSLTIEGIDVIIDSGLAREPVYDPATAMTRLHTRRISRASAEQRAGRAGRLGPGHCYRLWSPGQQQELAPHGTPEILSADLAPLALQLFQWGVYSKDELEWMDSPPEGPWQEAVARLRQAGAIDADHRLTSLGEQMAALPVDPRLARLLVEGARVGRTDEASLLAAMLAERNPLSADDPDIAHNLELLLGHGQLAPRHRGWMHRTRQLARQFNDQLSTLHIAATLEIKDDEVVPVLIAAGWPDRIARKRHGGSYQMANGRAASFADSVRIGKSRWLAVSEVGGMARRKGDVIRSMVALDEALFDTVLKGMVDEVEVVEWDKREKRFIAETRRMVGALVLSRARLEPVPLEARRRALVAHVREMGLGILPWTNAIRQWRARVELLREYDPDCGIPPVSDEHLLQTLDEWLAPWLDPVSRLEDFAKLDLATMLASRLSYEQVRQLAARVPERIEVPSGSKIAVDYLQSPPVLAVKLQEMFGCESTPTILEGRVALVVHLLSPAGRPLQITQDLSGFWRSSYQDVKKDMKGRYPKHPWPDDPLAAEPTRHTRHR